MDLSTFGNKFSGTSGIGELMEDLGKALSTDRSLCMLGGGNPAHIPEVETVFQKRLQEIAGDRELFSRVIGNYDCPQGEGDFIACLAGLLKKEFGWDVGPGNIAITLGSQSSFFSLFNMFGGTAQDGTKKKILLPLSPEYIGYADVGLEDDFFASSKPKIEFLDDQVFKYHVDFDALNIDDSIGAICVSRPTNPTGNVLTNEEIHKLDELAREKQVPFIIDNAYGTPFPNIIFTQADPVWNENTIVCMSLSKLGLPGTRTGVVIASEEVIQILSNINAITALAPSSLGVALALSLVKSGEILSLSRDVVRPYYKAKADRAVAQLREGLKDLPCYLHKPEGALFLWLWCKDLPIDSYALYERLKARGVLVVPGQYFFPGIGEGWRHTQECIRITYAQPEDVVERGLGLIIDELKAVFAG